MPGAVWTNWPAPKRKTDLDGSAWVPRVRLRAVRRPLGVERPTLTLKSLSEAHTAPPRGTPLLTGRSYPAAASVGRSTYSM